MTLQRHRRIFRGSNRAAPRRFARALVIGVTGTLGGAIVMMTAMSADLDLFGQAPRPGEEISAPAAQIAVIDGGTLRLGEQVVRLYGLVPPERGETCRGGARGEGGGFDCGVAAANALAGLLGPNAVDCRFHGVDRMGRPLAVCHAGSVELNRALVADGWARAAAGQRDLSGLEVSARADGRGIWGGRTLR